MNIIIWIKSVLQMKNLVKSQRSGITSHRSED